MKESERKEKKNARSQSEHLKRVEEQQSIRRGVVSYDLFVGL